MYDKFSIWLLNSDAIQARPITVPARLLNSIAPFAAGNAGGLSSFKRCSFRVNLSSLDIFRVSDIFDKS